MGLACSTKSVQQEHATRVRSKPQNKNIYVHKWPFTGTLNGAYITQLPEGVASVQKKPVANNEHSSSKKCLIRDMGWIALCELRLLKSCRAWRETPSGIIACAASRATARHERHSRYKARVSLHHDDRTRSVKLCGVPCDRKTRHTLEVL